MELLTAVRRGSFEIRICVTTNTLSPDRQHRLTEHLCLLMNRHSDDWSRYRPRATMSLALVLGLANNYFSSLQNIQFPQHLDQQQYGTLASLVALARVLMQYEYVVGIIDRASPRYCDFHCYTLDEVDYEEYWSAAEASLTQSEWTSDTE